MKHKMITRWALCAAVVLAAVALITGVALARTGGGVKAGAAGHYRLSGTLSQPDAAMLSGGRYQLTNVTLRDTQGNAGQMGDLASGGGYHLQGLAGPQLTGNGCCCVYLPCVRR